MPPSSTATADNAKTKNQNVRRNVYISGIPPVYRSEEFRHLCMQFGRVEAAKLCVDNRNAPTKAYGFALYYSEESAAACIRGLNGSFLEGRCLQARLADSHATPQPLGDEGSAANTTIPPPHHQLHRYEQRGGGSASASGGLHRKGRHHAGNFSGIVGSSNGSRRGVSPATATALSSPGIPSGLPTPPYTAIAAGATLFAPADGTTTTSMMNPTALPADMSAYYPFMTMLPTTAAMGATNTPTTTTTPPPPPPMINSVTTTPSTHPGSVSPATDGGFGAVGTPITGPLAAAMERQPQNCGAQSALSPTSMALSPPLLSSHSTESGSVSPTASRAAATNVANPAHVQSLLPYPATPTPYQISYLPQQPMLANVPGAGQVAIIAGTNADGTPTFMYCPLPTTTAAGGTGVSAFASTTSGSVPPQPAVPGMPTLPPLPMAKPNLGQLPGSVMYFSMPQGVGAPAMTQPQPQQPTYVQMGQNGLPANYVMLDGNSNNLGMQFQVLH
jgi:hypothetical protein